MDYAKLSIVHPMQSSRLCKVSYYDAHKYRILVGFTLHSTLLATTTAQITIPSGRCFRSNPAD